MPHCLGFAVFVLSLQIYKSFIAASVIILFIVKNSFDLLLVRCYALNIDF